MDIPNITATPPKAYSVSQVASSIKRVLNQAPDGWVEGEVRQISVHDKSGHCYLTLADESSVLSCVIWRGKIANCRPLPKQGTLVQAHYSGIDFYTPRGSVSLLLDEMRPTGEGELLRRRDEVLKKLTMEGLCDPERKKHLPVFPQKIGVIAGHDSDAKADVITALRKRFPAQDIVFHSALVQGVGAVGSVIDALAYLQSVQGVDVIIVARGGGSVSELAAFDDERLCRAIFACSVPVITSIGHTQNMPNCDHVAAAYAPVPAETAALAIGYSAEEILSELDFFQVTLERVTGDYLSRLEDKIEHLTKEANLYLRRYLEHQKTDLLASQAHLQAKLSAARLQLPGSSFLDSCAARLQGAATHIRGEHHNYERAFDRLDYVAEQNTRRFFADRRNSLTRYEALIEAKDFRKKGWVLVSDDKGQVIKTVAELRAGQSLELQFADGQATTTVDKIVKED